MTLTYIIYHIYYILYRGIRTTKMWCKVQCVLLLVTTNMATTSTTLMHHRYRTQKVSVATSIGCNKLNVIHDKHSYPTNIGHNGTLNTTDATFIHNMSATTNSSRNKYRSQRTQHWSTTDIHTLQTLIAMIHWPQFTQHCMTMPIITNRNVNDNTHKQVWIKFGV